MSGKVKVPLFGAPQRCTTIDFGATAGATFGVDVRWPDGTLVTAADFAPAPVDPGSDLAQTIWRLVLEIPPNVTALEEAAGTGLFAVTGDGTGAMRAIGSTTLDVANGDGVAGDPTVDLPELPDTGIGAALVKLTRDAYGRVEGTESATTDDLSEGATNLYFTDERADARIELQKGQPLGLATLDANSKLDAGQLPALAITETFVVNTEAAMLALVCQQGDVAVRTDLSKSFILTVEPASTLANWQELLAPTGSVTSFNGRTGSVVPATGDYTPAQVGAEPSFAAGTTAQYRRGDKTWQDFPAAVRAVLDGGQDSGWITPTLLNSWNNFGGSYSVSGYRKFWKIVFLRGLVSGGVATSGTVLMNLPAGFRPAARYVFPLSNPNSPINDTRIEVAPNGDIVLNGPVSASYVALDGIQFFVD